MKNEDESRSIEEAMIRFLDVIISSGMQMCPCEDCIKRRREDFIISEYEKEMGK